MFLGTRRTFTPLTLEEIRLSLSDKEILVVGGTKGLGAAFVLELAQKGNAIVTYTGKSCTDKELLETPRTNFVATELSTVEFARDLVRVKLAGKKFDTVIFCLTIFNKPMLVRNIEGIEEDMAVSYLNRFVILIELMKAYALTERCRVYNCGYPGEHNGPYNIDDINFDDPETKYKQLQAHLNPILFNDSLVYEAKQRYPDLDIFGLNTGLVHRSIRQKREIDEEEEATQTLAERLLDSVTELLHGSIEQYVGDVGIHLIAQPDLHSPCSFKQNGEVQLPLGWVAYEENRKRCWELSEQLVERAGRTTLLKTAS